MELYCVKHKQILVERYINGEKKIEPYCVDCEIEQKYQLHSKINSQESTFRKTTKLYLVVAVLFSFIVLVMPLSITVKVIVWIILLLMCLKKLLNHFLSSAIFENGYESNDIRAKILNQSSIQENEVAQRKRQWKKDFLQLNKGKKWTQEDWEWYLRQYYRKD
ncbi:hypothetical protein [Sutcliffiella rhizosphaerae]|uniref:Uncharacterized protein n=1 Tax=Sutcliffiella rhizosphaerae TaxID=2880967 RepID=A0ABN8AEF2_9BACI|nr:hypothetical protein [Sutcliffiella rhizosphaerae]CAG9621877.1 hypothetical protein BACCIP111883_02668 [Sutcliffiella rhizosphaerae]